MRYLSRSSFHPQEEQSPSRDQHTDDESIIVAQESRHPPCHLDNCKPRIPEGTDLKRWPLAQRHMELLGDWMDLVGGWHDAGIIDQYTGNTGLMTYALAALAEARPEVAAQARDEAVWGGRWLVKATLPTGAMVMQTGGQVRWTNNRPHTADDRVAPRAKALLMFPRSVLISPLWHSMRNGCARGQLGNVLVL